MIDEIELSGFKRHGTRTRLPLAPITLLLGSNSSGKSSVLQALLALRQSFDRGPTGFFDLETRGPLAALGRFGNVQTNHDPETLVSIGLRLGAAMCRFTFGDPDAGRQGRGTSIQNELQGLHLEYGGTRFCAESWPVERQDSDRWSVVGRLERDGGATNPAIRIAWSRHAYAYEVVGLSAAGGFDDGAIRALVDATLYRAREIVTRTRHIGPLRQPGRRAYEIDPSLSDDVGSAGENLATILLRGERLTRANALLKSIGVPYAAVTIPLETLGNTIDIRLEDTRGNVPRATVGIGDVGFGVSQLMPILAAWTVILERVEGAPEDRGQRRLLMVEQPELHLHPSWQVNLIRTLTEPLRQARANSAPDGFRVEELPQVVLETHSLILVRALQQLVRGGPHHACRRLDLVLRDRRGDRGQRCAPNPAGREGRVHSRLATRLLPPGG